MTALTASREDYRKEGILQDIPLKANAIVFKGGIVMNDSSGYAVAGADTASSIFRGVAYESKDNTGGADGVLTGRVWKKGTFRFAASGMAITNVGTEVYIVDDQTVGLVATTTNDIPCGKIAEFISATEVVVQIDGYAV